MRRSRSLAGLSCAVAFLWRTGPPWKRALSEARGTVWNEGGRSVISSSSMGVGHGNLEMVTLRHTGGATAEIYLFGATVTSYKTADGKEHFFLSPGAKLDGQKAIRGGVPVVFPQFGQPDKAMPQHGFARTSMWAVQSISDSDEQSRCILALNDSNETRKVWGHSFRLEYEVVLSAVSLTLTLHVHNPGDAPFGFQALLHTYLEVPDVGDVVVWGLSGRNYIDKVMQGERKFERNDEISFPSFTDRVYLGAGLGANNVTVGVKNGSLLYVMMYEAWMYTAGVPGKVLPCDIVMWNPYERASPADLPPPAFKQFVCIEPGLVGKTYQLIPKAMVALSQTLLPV